MKSAMSFIRMNKILLVLVHLIFCSTLAYSNPGLILSEFGGSGIDHSVVIESENAFKLKFEASYNYGLSLWNDANSIIDLCDNATDYLPSAEQGSLFNQLIAPLKGGDYGTVGISSKLYFKDNPRKISIVEKNNIRVILSTEYSLKERTDIVSFNTVYTIYSTGKLLLCNSLVGLEDTTIKEWRNSIIGLSDPQFLIHIDKGKDATIAGNTLTDITKKWRENQWAGYSLNIPGYNSWEIKSNSHNTLNIGERISGNMPLTSSEYSIQSNHFKLGWIRATDHQNPYGWKKEIAKYLYMYWDPSTPAPYSEWTKASIMLVPKLNNPYQGKQSTHDWKGFKRFYYRVTDIPLKKGASVVQHYYMQLGTKSSDLLPDLSKRTNTELYSADYLSDHPITVQTGQLCGRGYDEEKGCYTLTSLNNRTGFSMDGSITTRTKPVFEITDMSPDVIPKISLDGKFIRPEIDYIWHNDNKGMLLVQFLFDINSKSNISILPSSSTTTSLAQKERLSVRKSTGDSYSLQKTKALPEAENVVIPPKVDNGKNKSNELRQFAILCYSNESSQISSWIDKIFAYKISGSKPANPDVKWMTYFDIYGTGSLEEYMAMKDLAVSKGFSYEDMLLHSQKNYTSKIPVAFREMDRFDIFEGKNGILKTKDFKTFEDHSLKAYKAQFALSDTLCIGYEEPFAEVNLEFETVGRKVRWLSEFWNGSFWEPLTIVDGTEGFSHTGRMAFVPPGNWQPLSLNGSRSKYFVRFIFQGAEAFPVSSRIYGDNWLNEKSSSCRGWDQKSASVVNSGPLSFNPHPPAGASAKFRYQARIPFWSHGHFVANPSTVALSDNEVIRTWAKYAANTILSRASSGGHNGVMCDDGERNVASDGVTPELSDLPTGKDWDAESNAKYRDIVRYVKQQDAKLMVGINSQNKQLIRHGDWNLAEYNTFVWKTGSAGVFERNNSSKVMAYDDYAVSQNDKQVKGLLIYQDTVDIVPGIGAAWDRANRGPLTALSKHYIGANQNTLFSYYSLGGYIYSETDEVVLKNKKILHQASEPTPRVEDVHRWATWFPAMGVDIGTPDEKGHLGGARDTAWKKGGDIGGGPDVYRRDFTHAIVLHRPAFYNTTKAAYETYSIPIILEKALFPLRADGTTEPATAQISLRAGDGAILLKNPIAPSQR